MLTLIATLGEVSALIECHRSPRGGPGLGANGSGRRTTGRFSASATSESRCDVDVEYTRAPRTESVARFATAAVLASAVNHGQGAPHDALGCAPAPSRSSRSWTTRTTNPGSITACALPLVGGDIVFIRIPPPGPRTRATSHAGLGFPTRARNGSGSTDGQPVRLRKTATSLERQRRSILGTGLRTLSGLPPVRPPRWPAIPKHAVLRNCVARTMHISARRRYGDSWQL